jgi:hypothetical protein
LALIVAKGLGSVVQIDRTWKDTMMAAGHLGVIERHLGSRAQPSVIRAVTPRLTGDMYAESGCSCGKLSIRILPAERAASNA